MEFSITVKELMIKAGWSENRNINITLPYTDYPQSIIDFLHSYGNLIVQGIGFKDVDTIYSLEINPDLGKYESDSNGFYPYYSSLLKTKLFPLGYFRPDSYHICCDLSGRIYKIGEYCFYVGANVYIGIENILTMNTRQSLQLDEDTGKWWGMDASYVPLP
jgi:SUKH-3 immunity protein